MSDGHRMANAYTDHRSFEERRSRRLCCCGCGKRSTHLGTANGIGMLSGCELSVRRWVKQGPESMIRILGATR
jgi:hypothetical protein